MCIRDRRPVGADEALLGDVLHQIGVTHHPADQAFDASLVLDHQHLERAHIALFDARDEQGDKFDARAFESVENKRKILDSIDLTIHAGEILGIAGVEGNGQAELVEVVMGMREPSAGEVFLEDTDISDWQVREIREAGVGYIPEDRHHDGLVLDAPALIEEALASLDVRQPYTAALDPR